MKKKQTLEISDGGVSSFGILGDELALLPWVMFFCIECTRCQIRIQEDGPNASDQSK
jgi:hypothetical protein